jgi:hypothetical protein
LIRDGGALLLVAFVLLWPALYNGQPFFFPDTTAYLRGADAGIQKFTHHPTAWSAPAEVEHGNDGDLHAQPGAIGGESLPSPKSPASVSSVTGKTVLAGRSPYYGALLYLGELSGGFWLSIYVQGFSALVAIAFVLRAAGAPIWPSLPIMGLILAATTSLPFYASMLMPDLFAAVTILSCSTLIATRATLPRLDYVVWFILLGVALIFHDTHKLITVAMLALGIAWNLRCGWANWRGLATVVLALCLSAVAQLAFDFGVTRLVGAPPLHPPFLVARLIDDGPGYRYLKATCPDNGFVVCQYLDRLPMNADRFLWATGDAPGVFAEAPPEIKRRLAEEQFPFLLKVLRYDPVGVASIALRNARQQLTMTGLTEFLYTDEERNYFEHKVPAEHLRALRRSAAYTGAVPIDRLSTIDAGLMAAAVVLLAFALLRKDAAVIRARSSFAASVAAWILAGMFVNGAICGMLSGPHDRYSARVLWLLPFAVLLITREIWLNRFFSKATSTSNLSRGQGGELQRNA